MKTQAKEKNQAQFRTVVQTVKSMEAQSSVKSERLAILDTICAGSSAGREWVEDHIENLCPEDRRLIRRMEGRAHFNFGNGTRLKSQQRLIMPVYFAERRALLAVDMLEAKFPLLISLPAMKKAKTTIYTATDTANILGQDFKLVINTNGHYTLSMRKGEQVR